MSTASGATGEQAGAGGSTGSTGSTVERAGTGAESDRGQDPPRPVVGTLPEHGPVALGRGVPLVERPQQARAVGPAGARRRPDLLPADPQPTDHHDRAGDGLLDRAVQRRGLRADRDRAQRRHRPGGPARPGLRRLLRDRRLRRGAALLARLRSRGALPVDRDRADRHGHHDALGRHPRHADPAPARRLPGDRHARLRGARPAARGQRRPAAREPGLPEHRPPGRAATPTAPRCSPRPTRRASTGSPSRSSSSCCS